MPLSELYPKFRKEELDRCIRIPVDEEPGPELDEILSLIAEHPHVYLNTGHVSVDEALRLIDLAALIEGSIWIRDKGMAEPLAVRGRASLTHTWMNASEPEVALRRIDFASLDADTAIYLVDLETPGGKRTYEITSVEYG